MKASRHSGGFSGICTVHVVRDRAEGYRKGWVPASREVGPSLGGQSTVVGNDLAYLSQF